jgi:hypothetical protein
VIAACVVVVALLISQPCEVVRQRVLRACHEVLVIGRGGHERGRGFLLVEGRGVEGRGAQEVHGAGGALVRVVVAVDVGAGGEGEAARVGCPAAVGPGGLGGGEVGTGGVLVHEVEGGVVGGNRGSVAAAEDSAWTAAFVFVKAGGGLPARAVGWEGGVGLGGAA